jgi:hypothetical protein
MCGYHGNEIDFLSNFLSEYGIASISIIFPCGARARDIEMWIFWYKNRCGIKDL